MSVFSHLILTKGKRFIHVTQKAKLEFPHDAPFQLKLSKKKNRKISIYALYNIYESDIQRFKCL